MVHTQHHLPSGHLPRRVKVRQVLSSRYSPGSRPISWDDRKPGLERILTSDGETLELYSGGGQSTPAPGWELLLMKQVHPKELNLEEVASTPDIALSWTLYGISRTSTQKS